MVRPREATAVGPPRADDADESDFSGMVVRLNPPLYEGDRYLSKVANADRRLWHYLFLWPSDHTQPLWGQIDRWPILLDAQRLLDVRAIEAEIIKSEWLSGYCSVEGYRDFERIRYPDQLWTWLEAGHPSPAPWYTEPSSPPETKR